MEESKEGGEGSGSGRGARVDISLPLVDFMEKYDETCLYSLFLAVAHPTWVVAIGAEKLRRTLHAARYIRIQARRLREVAPLLPDGSASRVFSAFRVKFPPPVAILGQNPCVFSSPLSLH